MPLLKPANILGIRNSLNEVQDHDLKYILSEKTFIFIIFQFVTLTHIVQNFSYKNKKKKTKKQSLTPPEATAAGHRASSIYML